jgi:hypothetical protein
MAETEGKKESPRPKRPSRPVRLLKGTFVLLKRLALLTALALGTIELLSPSLNFSKGPGSHAFRSDTPLENFSLTTESGRVLQSKRTEILTSDYRRLTVDALSPDNLIGKAPLPLTIVVTGFLEPEWTLDQFALRSQNAVIVYRSPRQERMLGPAWPNRLMLRDSLWLALTTNPVTKWYNLHQGLHEAPLDISEIARWAVDTLGVERTRINLIGLGSGGLLAAAAAERMQSMGLPARSLTMIYPPAELDSAIRDNLDLPEVLRDPASKALAFLYRRLDLSRHLPFITTSVKQLIIPINAFELATYAALPAVTLAGENIKVRQVNVNYSGYYLNQNVAFIRDTVLRWLVEQGAIN